MIYHLFDASKVHHVPRMITNFQKYYRGFNNENHTFLLFNHQYADHYIHFRDKGFRIKELKSFIKLTRLIFSFRRGDALIIHGITDYRLFVVLYSISFFKRLNNVGWVCWGAGLHVNNSRKARIYKTIKTKVFNSMGAIRVLMNSDKEQLEQRFDVAGVGVLPYLSDVFDFANLDVDLESIEPKGSVPNVALGNNSNTGNRHSEGFRLLKKFSEEIFHLHVNLSYGSEHTKDKIIAEGYKTFPSQVIFINKMLSPVDYRNFIVTNYDIIFLPAEKQIGLFVIHTALYFGKKVYLDGNNFLWFHSRGFKVFNVNDVTSIPFNEFVKPLSKAERLANRQLFVESYSNATFEKGWAAFIDQLSK